MIDLIIWWCGIAFIVLAVMVLSIGSGLLYYKFLTEFVEVKRHELINLAEIRERIKLRKNEIKDLEDAN